MNKLDAMFDWLTGMKPRHIAEKYGVSVNTIRSWHHRHKWARARRKLWLMYQLRIRGLSASDAEIERMLDKICMGKARKKREKRMTVLDICRASDILQALSPGKVVKK